MAKLDSIADVGEGVSPSAALALSEDLALARFSAVRWKHGAFCPHCGSAQVYHFSDNRTHKCGACRQRFSAKVGTIFEESKVGLASWLVAIHSATESESGVTAAELARRTGLTQKTAAHMLNRIRLAAQTPSFHRPLEEGVLSPDPTPAKSIARFSLTTGEKVA